MDGATNRDIVVTGRGAGVVPPHHRFCQVII